MSDPARRYFPVSWEELHRDFRALSWRLAERGPWERIVAIARGGLVPAQIVAREARGPADRHHLRVVLRRAAPARAAHPQADRGHRRRLADRRRPGRHRQDRAARARDAARGAFRHGVRQAGGPPGGRYLHHRGQPGHLDSVSLGRSSPGSPSRSSRCATRKPRCLGCGPEVASHSPARPRQRAAPPAPGSAIASAGANCPAYTGPAML